MLQSNLELMEHNKIICLVDSKIFDAETQYSAFLSSQNYIQKIKSLKQITKLWVNC